MRRRRPYGKEIRPAILSVLDEHPGWDAGQVAEHLGLSIWKVIEVTDRLLSEGVLTFDADTGDTEDE